MSPQSRSDQEHLEKWFIRSSYVTLLLACAALIWAELVNDLVPAMAYVAAALVPLLLTAYWVEGRWALSTKAANLLGMLIGVAAGVWAIHETVNPRTEGPLATMPWPTSMVPLLGPLLLMLLPAKLFRPKTVADHWGLQIIGLACVGLGCALTDDGIFGALVALYLLSLLWCLAQFFLYRERLVRAAAERPRSPRPTQVLSWAAPIFVLALAGFLALPRSSAIWQVPRQDKRLEVGATEDSGIDLNRTGTLTFDAEVAFEVSADDGHGNAKLDLPGDQRWRGPVYRLYRGGSWRNPGVGVAGANGSPVAVSTTGAAPAVDELPDYDVESKFYLTYFVKSKIGPLPFLADPVYRPDARVPVVSLLEDGRLQNWSSDAAGNLKPPMKASPGKTRYRQVTVPAPANGLSHPVRRIDLSALRELPSMDRAELARLRGWAEDLLKRLSETGEVQAEAVSERDVDGYVHPRHFERIARAFEAYLARSGEYRYSLTLERVDHEIDPTLDFLFNIRIGHCNRFASALAVMLRSLRIPCQVVLGFRGAESRGDGTYDVRQYHAHSWVEALVPVREPPPAHGMHQGRENWHWLALDPTPADSVSEASAERNLLFGMDLNLRRLYRDLIIGYSAENRDSFFNELGLAARAMAKAFRRQITARTPEGFRMRITTSLFVLTLLTLMLIAGRWIRRRLLQMGLWPAPAYPGTAFYQRLLAVLARHGLKPAPSQTPREFADSVADRLARAAGTAEFIAVVRATVNLYYRVRFGGRPLDAAETRLAVDGIDRLARALAVAAN